MFGNLGLAALLTIAVFWVGAGLAALGALLVLLAVLRARGRTRRVRPGLLVTGLVLLAIPATCTAWLSRPPPHHAVRLDLSQTREVAQLERLGTRDPAGWRSLAGPPGGGLGPPA